MKIWKNEANLKGLNDLGRNTMVSHLNIEITEIGPDYLIATMPVDDRTKQPMGLLHGGASAALAETLGSVAGVLCLEDPLNYSIVGIEITATHLRSAKEGLVTAKATPVKVGKKTQVWDIEIKDDKARKVCVSRLTCMVIKNQA